VLAPGFYARQNVKTPVRIALISLAATQLMNLAFIGWIGHAGLALSIGLAACLNAGMLYRGLRRLDIYHPQPGWTGFVLKLLLALLVMAGVLWFGMGREAGWLQAVSCNASSIWPGWCRLARRHISLHYGHSASGWATSNGARPFN
jgi:putative peptidoglycan lipid II flippase